MKPISVFTLGGNIDRKIIGVGLDTTGITKGDDQSDLFYELGFGHLSSVALLKTDIPLHVVEICRKVGNTLTSDCIDALRMRMTTNSTVKALGQRILVTAPAGRLVDIAQQMASWTIVSGRCVILTGTDAVVGRDEGEIEEQLDAALQRLIARPFAGVYIMRGSACVSWEKWVPIYGKSTKEAYDVELGG